MENNIVRMQLAAEVCPEWPPLAWCARLVPGDSTVRVRVGRGVEAIADALFEAVWDGPFDEARFDLTDIVAGTGVRIGPEGVVFVSSGSTVDRLVVMRMERDIHVSNSLSCLLCETSSRPVVTYPHYYRDIDSITKGLNRYQREIPTTRLPVELVYFDNLRWDSRALVRIPKPNAERHFSCFGEYHDFLRRSLDGIAGNASSTSRRTPLALLTTLSSGYDSSTVTTLASEVGCRSAISCSTSRERHDDSGTAVAATLGLTVHRIERGAHAGHPEDEVLFHAGDGEGSESFFGAARDLLRNKVLLTGFHGDKLWAKDTRALGADIVRGDASGLSMTEYRLRHGFLHCPIPFWAARNIRSILAISNSGEMKPWDVGGHYSRPICRRIVESAGVPRDGFGTVKSASAKTMYESSSFLLPCNYVRYREWLAKHRFEWLIRGRLPPSRLADWPIYIVEAHRKNLATRLMRFVGGKPLLWRSQKRLRRIRDRWASQYFAMSGLRRYCVQWALEEAMRDFLSNHVVRSGRYQPKGEDADSRHGMLRDRPAV